MRLPEDLPHGRFATEDSPHNECDREFERKRRTNVCNSADVEDSPHNNDRLGSGGVESEGLGLGGLRSGAWARGVGVRGIGSKVGPGGLGWRVPNPPQTPNPQPQPQPSRPNSPPQPFTVVWRIFHIGAVANVCPTLTLKFSVTFVCLTHCVSNLL